MDKLEALGGPWQMGVRAASLSKTFSGRENPGGGPTPAWDCIDTANQKMNGTVNFYSYKLKKAEKVKEDYHAVYGLMRHGIQHLQEPYDPSANWHSVGYYSSKMSLVLGITFSNDDENAGEQNEYSVWDAGPTSTVGENTTSFSIGANLSGTAGDFETVSGGVDVSFGTSFSSPNVVISQKVLEQTVRWDVQLPGVGFKSPGVPANPFPPSCAGYVWYFGAIFKTPGNSVPTLVVHPRVEWEFDWTRGITNHEVTWEETDRVKLTPPESA